MPIIYSGERYKAEDRSDISQYALWFDRNDMNFSINFSWGEWVVSAYDRRTMTLISGERAETVEKALHNCYVQVNKRGAADFTNR